MVSKNAKSTLKTDNQLKNTFIVTSHNYNTLSDTRICHFFADEFEYFSPISVTRALTSNSSKSVLWQYNFLSGSWLPLTLFPYHLLVSSSSLSYRDIIIAKTAELFIEKRIFDDIWERLHMKRCHGTWNYVFWILHPVETQKVEK